MPAIKNWTPIQRLLLKLHNLLNRLIMLLVISTMEKGKGVEKGKEVEVAVLTEVVIMIIMGVVVSMMQAMDLLDMAKGARIMVTMGTRVTIIMETRISASHPTSNLNLFTRISSHGNNNRDLVSSSTTKGIRVEVTRGTVVVAIMVGVLEVAATGAWVCLITSMGRATGRPSVLHNLFARSAADPT